MAKVIENKLIVRIELYEEDEALLQWFSLFKDNEQYLSVWISAALFSALSNQPMNSGMVSIERILENNGLGISGMVVEVPVYNKELVCGFRRVESKIISDIVKEKIYDGLSVGEDDLIPNISVPREIVLRETIRHRNVVKGSFLLESRRV